MRILVSSSGDQENVYIFRDVRGVSGNLETCQYATIRDGKVQWTDCEEGAKFCDVEAIATVNAKGRDTRLGAE